ncbi:MAG: class I SAM-dependent DNA methyltransferase [Verrucomicrobia bacterium]|nr:class I SAM-dependent DNA methyltransferase [Verrucomicrobiota bacterium]
MTAAEFKKKWSRYTGKESAAYQEHFNDLCRLLGQPTPAEADPTGAESFCFQKRVVKDAELFNLKEEGVEYDAPDLSPLRVGEERGFADVWKKGCFAWEYKGKKKNLDDAYKQLLRYRESLLNPPLLVVCDFERYIIRTNFNGTVQETHEFTNANLDEPRVLGILRALFANPDYLKPVRSTSEVTEKLAAQIAEVARSLQGRECVELRDARTRDEVRVAQKQNLRIARFLNRIIFCFFAEDTGLLPKGIFSEITKASLDDVRFFSERLEELFRAMASGGSFGAHKIRHFNGHLLEEATVFELTPDEIRALAGASEADWQFIEPSILGKLFERGLDPDQRAQLGAHYTSRQDIETLVEPVLMMPLRREWTEIKRDILPRLAKGKGTAADRVRLASFQNKLSAITVLDPACGSGNFLYVSLQLLLSLEKEVIAFAAHLSPLRRGELGFKLMPQVDVHQLKAIEINPYAFELAQVSVQIGYLQWMRDNGFLLDRTPILQTLDGFENKDALLNQTFRKKPASLKAARAGEHAADDTLKVYTERAWPACDVIVSNPPFLGGGKLWEALGREYQQELWRVFEGRLPGFSDFCCYWFEKAREQIKDGKCKRAGLLATQGIRGGANREVLKRIKETGGIFFAVSDRDWILDGATVHVSMIGFDNGEQKDRMLDGRQVTTINANLTAHSDVTQAQLLSENVGLSIIGTKKAGAFDISDAVALLWFNLPNPHGLPNSDVLRPWVNGSALVQRRHFQWIIDGGTDMKLEEFSLYEQPYKHVLAHVKPERDKSNEPSIVARWWLMARPRPEFRSAIVGQHRYLATPRVSKYRIFLWVPSIFIPDDGVFTFARSDDCFFGLLHSHFHEVWSRAQGTQVRERESGFRYTPTSCFETFPFPQPTAEQKAAIAAAAKELNELRERWLNPPEWTAEKILEFPGSVSGPWAPYMVPHSTLDTRHSALKLGTVRYPRLEPKDAECAKKLKDRTLTKLYNERPTWLDLAHKKLDEAVAAAYGWPADLPEDEILKRLLELNLQRAAADLSPFREGEAKLEKPKPKKSSRAKHEDEMI